MAMTTIVMGSLISAPVASAQKESTATWKPCPKAAITAPDALCTTFQVPQDYRNPTGKKITLTMSKIPATGQSKGVIAGNPGGPGGDALGMFAGNASPDPFGEARVTLPKDVREHYDQIAVEPRGLAFGQPLICGLDGPAGLAAPVLTPGNIRDLCNMNHPGLVDSITTANTARDLNEARKVLGQDKLNLYGVSYGGLLMATYATMFPGQTGKTLLDSTVSQKNQWLSLEKTRGAQRRDSLEAMFQWIADRDDTYHLGKTPMQVYKRWSDRINKQTGVPAQITPPDMELGDLPAGLRPHGKQVLPVVNKNLPAMWRLYSGWKTLEKLSPEATARAPLFTYTLFTGLYDESKWDSVATFIRDGKLKDDSKTDGAQKKLEKDLQKDEKALRDVAYQSLTMGTVELAIVCNENRNRIDSRLIAPYLVDKYTGGDVMKNLATRMSSGQLCAGWPLPKPSVTLSSKHLQTKPLLLGYNHDSAVTRKGMRDMHAVMGGEMVELDGHKHGVLVHDTDKVADKVSAYFA
ncbi:alpha/beta hydrolase [Corynebacterium auriscanis]|uniref:alpha/beta fold hydrolase n=1 Tax=Corynebacterium auriscanis TaxID=99807 RepID=UPI003CEA1972